MREFDLAVLPALKLHLNIKHPSLEECYLLGYDSALEKEAEISPFKAESLEAEHWLEGWTDAMLGSEPLYKEALPQEQSLFNASIIEDALKALHKQTEDMSLSPKHGK